MQKLEIFANLKPLFDNRVNRMDIVLLFDYIQHSDTDLLIYEFLDVNVYQLSTLRILFQTWVWYFYSTKTQFKRNLTHG